ncbi:MAG: phosphotransferase [Caldilineaceae bacterium]|nr:phosphotransferase [Caldilineaceae bacterium]
MGDVPSLGQEVLSSSLSQYLSTQAGQAVQVTRLTRLSNGWESDVYAFEAPAWRAGEYVLRLYFGADAGPKALGEYRALTLLVSGGYPVPQVELVEPVPDALGRAFLVMQRIEGVSLGQLWRDPDPAVRERAMARFCELLAALHRLEWSHLPGADKVQSLEIADQFALWKSYIGGYAIESLEPALKWLESASAQVTPQPLGLVHWDFHHENILVDPSDQAWVIDWTQLQATDVRFDLAWTLVLLASERDPETAAAVRAGYLALRGWDEAAIQEELNFFLAAACAKRLVSVLVSMRYGADSLGMRPGAEAIMSSRLARIALVYKQWLSLTATPLAELEELLAEHL